MNEEKLQQAAKEAAEAYSRSPGTRQIFTDGYLSGYEAAQVKWIDVNERLPDVIADVLIGHKDDEWVSIGYLSDDKNFYNVWDNKCECYPTHWTPLPPKP